MEWLSGRLTKRKNPRCPPLRTQPTKIKMLTPAEYVQAMKEAKIEFDQWFADKRKNRKSDKAKFKAQRLAKLDAARDGSFDNQ